MLGAVSSPFLHALTCSKCGAALDPESGGQILVCPYCQTSHVFAPPPAPVAPAPRARASGKIVAIAAGALLAVSGAGLAVWRSGAPQPSSTALHSNEDQGPGNPNLVYVAEQKVDIWHVGRWYAGRIRTASNGRYFVTYDGWTESWDEWVTARRLRPRSEATASSAGDPLASYDVGQSVDIYWGSTWWPGRILEKDGKRYHITYDGWAESWNEWVQADRLRKREAAK